MSEEKPKEGVKTENDHINLKVAGQDGSVVQFKIKRHTPLNKLMKAYCERQGLSIRQIRFRFDGQPINETDTPSQVSRASHFSAYWKECTISAVSFSGAPVAARQPVAMAPHSHGYCDQNTAFFYKTSLKRQKHTNNTLLV
ncbi:small ubiquitin-related modifier 3-like isoform X1 [Phycodurus eques]|uniref:small ubiquitin-related modifier 3-like isoform X1 n=1 Tax=Phycodurus eques TaxID=693459 RepID=UPI002ACDB917|nr:small ubiquitin-related modifier 3-like isoform X1 [Phycodurus eques]